LEASSQISEEAVRQYLSPYVQFLPVPVLVNGQNISQKQFENAVEGQASGFVSRPPRNVFRGAFAGELQTLINPQGRVIARLRRLSLNGTDLVGEVFFLQDGGQTQGYRNLFGLAPIPVSGNYAFGGFVNLNILHPTAGREALSRESIEHVANIVALIEAEVSNELAETDAADRNQNFQQYISTHGLIAHAKRMTLRVLPSDHDVELGSISAFEPGKPKLFYAGREPTILKRFGTCALTGRAT
jgi:molecular chaperone HtpG